MACGSVVAIVACGAFSTSQGDESSLSDNDAATTITQSSDAGAAVDGPYADATSDATVDNADAGDSGGTVPCPCPSGTTEKFDNGQRTCFAESATVCNSPFWVTCAVDLDLELCAGGGTHNFGPECDDAVLPATFFELGPLDSVPPTYVWRVKSQFGTTYLGRADGSCSGTGRCGKGGDLEGYFSPGGNPVAVGRVVSSGCTVVRISVAPSAPPPPQNDE